MALIRANSGSGGSGGDSIGFSLMSSGGLLSLVKNGEVVYNSPSASFYLAFDYTDDDNYIRIWKSASSYTLNIEYKKDAEETIIRGTAPIKTVTSKSAGSTGAITYNSESFSAKF